MVRQAHHLERSRRANPKGPNSKHFPRFQYPMHAAPGPMLINPHPVPRSHFHLKNFRDDTDNQIVVFGLNKIPSKFNILNDF